MGYSSTTIVFYGIKINEGLAQKLVEQLDPQESGEIFIPSCPQIFRKVAPSDPRYPQKYPVTNYADHDEGVESLVFCPQILSEDTDSRIHSLMVEPGHQHYFGIYIASKGYAFQDQIKSFIQNLPKEAVDNYNLAIQPIIDQIGLTDKPELFIIQQVW